MMNPPRKERPVEAVARNLRVHRDLVIAVLFLAIGFLMGKF